MAEEDTVLVNEIEKLSLKKSIALKKAPKHSCYLLESTVINRTYVGYTVDLKRRLRQHNGEIKGGAKRSRWGKPWCVVGYLGGFPNSTVALQFEWALHHCRKGGWGCNGRIRAIEILLESERVTAKAPLTKNLKLTMYWVKEGMKFDRTHLNCKEEKSDLFD